VLSNCIYIVIECCGHFLKGTLHEHKEKVASLQSALQTTQEKLNQQMAASKEQVNLIAVVCLVFLVATSKGSVML
jgi:hypothetical protein